MLISVFWLYFAVHKLYWYMYSLYKLEHKSSAPNKIGVLYKNLTTQHISFFFLPRDRHVNIIEVPVNVCGYNYYGLGRENIWIFIFQNVVNCC